jgi:hypothetical protein
MIIDKETLLSDGQAITATANSTHIYDTGSAADVGRGSNQAIETFARVGAAFNNLTSLAVVLQTATDAAFTTPIDLWSKSFPLAELTANKDLKLPLVPRGARRYLRFRYVVTGTNPTTGTLDAGLVLNVQDWEALKAETGN